MSRGWPVGSEEAEDALYYERKMLFVTANESLQTLKFCAQILNGASVNGQPVIEDILKWDAASVCRRELERLAELGITDSALRPNSQT